MPALKGHTPWNKGKGKGWTDQRGYRWIYVFENGKRRAKREHRHIVEQSLGRALKPEEVVHHINGNTADNRIENLSVTTWQDHTADHHNGSKRNDAAKIRIQVLANYREEHKRLREINADLLEALKMAVRALQDNDIDESMAGEFEILTDAVAKAEGQL